MQFWSVLGPKHPHQLGYYRPSFLTTRAFNNWLGKQGRRRRAAAPDNEPADRGRSPAVLRTGRVLGRGTGGQSCATVNDTWAHGFNQRPRFQQDEPLPLDQPTARPCSSQATSRTPTLGPCSTQAISKDGFRTLLRTRRETPEAARGQQRAGAAFHHGPSAQFCARCRRRSTSLGRPRRLRRARTGQHVQAHVLGCKLERRPARLLRL